MSSQFYGDKRLVYLDNAATTFPKPVAVTEEVTRCLREYCGNPGRSGHRLSMAAADKIYGCREELADFFGASDPTRVVFTSNCTSALNLALKGLRGKGFHLITSDLEHNSVRRPLERLSREGKITYSRFPAIAGGTDPSRICREIASRIRPDTRVVAATAASNVCSAVLPLYEIGQLCAKRNLLFIVDGAQGAGHVPIDMKAMNISMLAVPGHKGLYGPQGSGALILGDGIELDTLTEGGSGSASYDSGMPSESPERYEAGTLSTPAIAGLCEGVRMVKQIGIRKISTHDKELFRACRFMLSSLPGIRVIAPEYEGSVLSFICDRIPCDRVADELDRRGICVRSGLHCSPWAHEALGTPDGTVRVSFSIFNTADDIEALYLAMREIMK